LLLDRVSALESTLNEAYLRFLLGGLGQGIYIHTFIRICIYIYVYIHIHIHIYKHTHTYIYTYIYILTILRSPLQVGSLLDRVSALESTLNEAYLSSLLGGLGQGADAHDNEWASTPVPAPSKPRDATVAGSSGMNLGGSGVNVGGSVVNMDTPLAGSSGVNVGDSGVNVGSSGVNVGGSVVNMARDVFTSELQPFTPVSAPAKPKDAAREAFTSEPPPFTSEPPPFTSEPPPFTPEPPPSTPEPPPFTPDPPAFTPAAKDASWDWDAGRSGVNGGGSGMNAFENAPVAARLFTPLRPPKSPAARNSPSAQHSPTPLAAQLFTPLRPVNSPAGGHKESEDIVRTRQVSRFYHEAPERSGPKVRCNDVYNIVISLLKI